MEIKKTEKQSRAIKWEIKENDKVIGRAFLYLIYNDLHSEPYGLIEDIFIDDNQRGKGMGTKLVKKIIEEAKNIGCYKLIACSRYSRPQIHEWYKKLGFEDYGKEFKIKLTNN
jgi:N-acetylglutamate synthase-like GNAT family acetyltransferase